MAFSARRAARNKMVSWALGSGITGRMEHRDEFHEESGTALTKAKTATGGTFNSDGRILVLVLKNTTGPVASSN